MNCEQFLNYKITALLLVTHIFVKMLVVLYCKILPSSFMSQQPRDLIDYKLVVGQSSELIFRDSCREVKLVVRVASLHLTWVKFIFTINSTLAFSEWHFDKTYNQ